MVITLNSDSVMFEVLFVIPGSQTGTGISCRRNHLYWDGCNVLGMSELLKKILKNGNSGKHLLLAVKESKTENMPCHMVEKIVVTPLEYNISYRCNFPKVVRRKMYLLNFGYLLSLTMRSSANKIS